MELAGGRDNSYFSLPFLGLWADQLVPDTHRTGQTARENGMGICYHCTNISWVDYPYTASTCDIVYCRQRRHLYYGGENLKCCLAPSPAVLPS
jgi:hypothetical protein